MKQLFVGLIAALALVPTANAEFGYVDLDDVCPNLEGVQPVVPDGYDMKFSHRYGVYICHRAPR